MPALQRCADLQLSQQEGELNLAELLADGVDIVVNAVLRSGRCL